MEKYKQTKGQIVREILRFLLVGVIATLLDYFVFWLFDGVLFPRLGTGEAWAGCSLALATALGFLVGLLVNWWLSLKFVFRAVRDKREAGSKKSFLLFAVIGVVGLVLTEVGVLLLVAVFPPMTLFGSTAFLGTAWEKWLAKAVMTLVVLVWNYAGRKLFVFKP